MPVIEPKNRSVTDLRGLHLYHSGISNCSMRVRMTLSEKALEWHSHHLDLRKKEHITEEYFGINPKGLVPTLVHDGKVITESADIIDYLDLEFPEPPLRPTGEADVERMQVWLHRAASIHIKAVKTFIYEKRMRGRMTQSAEEKARYESLQKDESLLEFHRKSASDNFSRQEIDEARATLDKCFTDLDETLGSRQWIAGERFSLADIAWIPLYFTLQVLAGYSFEHLPAVPEWAQRVADRPSYESAILDWWPADMKPAAGNAA